MKIQTVVFACAFLVLSLVQYSDAVPCSDTVTTGCTDCTDPANVDEPDCVTTTEAATTLATDTTTAAAGTVTTTVASGATTTAATGGSSNRRLLRRIRYLQRRLAQCRKYASNQRAALIKQIKKLTASSNNGFKNKFFG